MALHIVHSIVADTSADNNRFDQSWYVLKVGIINKL